MSSTRHDPEGDFMGLIPPSVFGGEADPILEPPEVVSSLQTEVIQPAYNRLAAPETVRKHLAAARAALAEMQNPG